MSAKATRQPRRVRRHCRGVVMLEFLVALIPMMLAFLGAIQLAWVAAAKLLVGHSAHMAARAAIVVVEESTAVPGTPANIYGGSPAGRLEDAGAGGSAFPQPAGPGGSSGAGPTGQLRSLIGNGRTRTRLDQIRTAAYLPLLIASPGNAPLGPSGQSAPASGESFKWGDDDFVGAALGGPDQARLAAALAYNKGMVAVTFPGSDGQVAPGQEITVRVSYLFRCQVPLVSLIVCDSGAAMLSADPQRDIAARWDLGRGSPSGQERSEEAKARFDAARQRLQAVGQARADWSAVESPTWQRKALQTPGARFILLQAEATLPAQSARYYPRG